jgi:hypothetical protein
MIFDPNHPTSHNGETLGLLAETRPEDWVSEHWVVALRFDCFGELFSAINAWAVVADV